MPSEKIRTCRWISTEGPEFSYREELRNTSCDMCPSCDLHKKLCENESEDHFIQHCCSAVRFGLVHVEKISTLRTMSSATSAEKCILATFSSSSFGKRRTLFCGPQLALPTPLSTPTQPGRSVHGWFAADAKLAHITT